MKVYSTFYRNVQAVAAETETLRALFLPDYGGKLTSLIYKPAGAELLAQADGDKYKPLTLTSSYVDGECSAFDDMFPDIDPQGVRYPCHGEVCRGRHSVTLSEAAIEMSYVSSLLPYIYKKRISEECGGIKISYDIENLGCVPLDCMWAGHIMLAATEGGELHVPFKPGAPVEFTFDENCEFGEPLKPNTLKSEMLVSRKYDADNGNTYKLYFTDKHSDGSFSYSRPDIGISVCVKIDSEAVPYLGVWLNNGKFKGMYNAALEPCTAPFDNPEKAKVRGYASTLGTGASMKFDLVFSTGETE